MQLCGIFFKSFKNHSPYLLFQEPFTLAQLYLGVRSCCAKLLCGSEDPDLTALSEAVRTKLGITEHLAKPAMVSPSLGLTSLAKDLRTAKISRLLPKVTCPSPSTPVLEQAPSLSYRMV